MGFLFEFFDEYLYYSHLSLLAELNFLHALWNFLAHSLPSISLSRFWRHSHCNFTNFPTATCNVQASTEIFDCHPCSQLPFIIQYTKVCTRTCVSGSRKPCVHVCSSIYLWKNVNYGIIKLFVELIMP